MLHYGVNEPQVSSGAFSLSSVSVTSENLTLYCVVILYNGENTNDTYVVIFSNITHDLALN